MASLPITLMTKDVTTLQSQSDTLDTINTKFATLQTAVKGMSDAMLGSSFQAEISDHAVVSATLGDAAQEGTYSIDVQNVGAYAVSMTPSNWDGTSSAKHAYQLWVGDMSDPKNKIDITPDNDSAATVAAAINAKASDKVRATVVNVGSTSSPDYRISLQSTTLGAKPDATGRCVAQPSETVRGRGCQHQSVEHDREHLGSPREPGRHPAHLPALDRRQERPGQ